MELLKSRKAFAFFFTAAATAMLQRFGMSPEDLAARSGFSLAEIEEATFDLLIQAALPAWIGWAWPNDPDCGIVDYWRVAASGVGLIGAAAALGWWL